MHITARSRRWVLRVWAWVGFAFLLVLSATWIVGLLAGFVFIVLTLPFAAEGWSQ